MWEVVRDQVQGSLAPKGQWAAVPAVAVVAPALPVREEPDAAARAVPDPGVVASIH
jgi:hypothetical protein